MSQPPCDRGRWMEARPARLERAGRWNFHQLGDGPVAAERVQKAVQSERTDPVYSAPARRSLAQAYARLGDKGRALDALQKVDTIGARDPETAKIQQSAAALRKALRGSRK